jgi:uncharacterized membrane protein YphA (DoxX/SURF4 family)
MISAGVFKISSFPEFVFSIYQFDLLPVPFISYFAVLIIAIEVTGGFLLLFGIWRKQISIIFILLLSLFTAAMLINLFKEKTIDCGCFGPLLPNQIGWWSLVRNVILIALLYCIYEGDKKALTFYLRKQ